MKKTISLILIIATLLCSNMSVLAREEISITSYEDVLAKINQEYGQQLKIQSVDTSKISIQDFEIVMRNMANQQKELKEFVANREEYVLNDIHQFFAGSARKTVKKDCWNNDSFYMTATYDVNGNQISNPRNISVGTKIPLASYVCNSGSPTSQIIDSGRTLTVSAYGTYRNDFAGVHISNVYLYTEFYFDS